MASHIHINGRAYKEHIHVLPCRLTATRSFGRQLYDTKKQAWFQDAAPKKLHLNKEEAAEACALVGY